MRCSIADLHVWIRFVGRKGMRPLLRVVCLAAGCAFISARAPVPSSEDVVLLADRDYPPLSYLNDGTPSGVDVDIASAISEAMGRRVRVVLTDWESAQERVLKGEADGLLSMSVSSARTESFDFTDPISSHEFGMFAPAGAPPIRGLADLAGKRVGVTRGGLPRRLLESHAQARLVFISNYEDGFARLGEGALDAVAADRWVGSYTLERSHLPNIVTSGSPFASAQSGIAVRKGNTAVLDAINHGIRDIKANGRLDEIQSRWSSQEMLFVSRQHVHRVALLGLGGAVAAALAGIAMWAFTVRHARARRAVESALVSTEQDLRDLLTRAQKELAERRHAEDRLRLLAHALQSASDCICITDTSNRILYVNEAFLRIYEYTQDELMGRDIGIVRSPGDAGSAPTRDDVTRDAWRGTMWNRSKSGRVFPVALATSTVHDEHGAIVAVVGVARDMTHEMAAEESLRRTEIRYRDLVENANDIIFTVDADGYCLSMNRAGRRISGYVAEDSRGVHLTQIVAPDHAGFAARQLARVLAGEAVPTFELEIVSKEGRRLTLELDVRPYGDGPASAVQGIARDVTARKELEDQLRQAQKMEAIGRLAAGVAHDFNNLLTVIISYAELIGTALPPHDPLHQDVGEIRRAGTSAASLTRQLLIFSRKNVVNPELLDLNDIVDQLERMLRRIVGEDIDMRVRQTIRPVLIEADAGQIEQVIMNLVVNARDAMPAGGSLTIETAAVDLDDQLACAHPEARPGPFVRLTVADTGQGMTAEVQAQIFTPFFTTKGPATGTGLGLSTVHGIVQESGGWIEVESAVGKGSRFSIHLPRLESVMDAFDATGAAAATPSPVSATILFVEDDESIRTLATRSLRQHGFTVLPARTAVEALQLAEDRERRIDLLLTDIVMPGPSGLDLTARLRLRQPDLKVLYTSGYADDAASLQDIDANGGFIQKPYSTEALVRRVRAILSGIS